MLLIDNEFGGGQNLRLRTPGLCTSAGNRSTHHAISGHHAKMDFHSFVASTFEAGRRHAEVNQTAAGCPLRLAVRSSVFSHVDGTAFARAVRATMQPPHQVTSQRLACVEGMFDQALQEMSARQSPQPPGTSGERSSASAAGQCPSFSTFLAARYDGLLHGLKEWGCLPGGAALPQVARRVPAAQDTDDRWSRTRTERFPSAVSKAPF